MSLSLTVHFLEGYEPRAGVQVLPVALGIHATQTVTVARNIRITALMLEDESDPSYELGFVTEAGWLPSVETLEIGPGRSTFLVSNLLEFEPSGRVLSAGQFRLFAKAFCFLAKKESRERLVADPAEELGQEDYVWQTLQAERSLRVA